jgi:hypothetical protein
MKAAEVLEAMKPIRNVKTRVLDYKPNTRVIINPENWSLRPGGGALIPLEKKGEQALTNFVGIPKSIAENLSPELFGKVATELLGRKERFTVLMIEGFIVDFVQGAAGMQALDSERLVGTIEKAIHNADIQKVTIGKDFEASLEIVGDTRVPVQRGDLIRAGALVRFSPTGSIAPLVQSFCVRLACTNGATDTTVLREFHGGGEGDSIWQWFRQSLGAAYGSVNNIANRYREMINDKLPAGERALMLEELLRQARITGEAADAVRAQAIEHPPRNAYEMFNLITWASSHLLKAPAQIDRARSIAAAYTSAESHDTFCPVCHSHRAPRVAHAAPLALPAAPESNN